MKTLLLATTCLFSLTVFAARPKLAEQIEDLSIIPLGNTSSHVRVLNYPGMGHGRSDQPDCLVFVTEKWEVKRILLKLAEKLVVTDLDNLPLEVINGKVVFKFTDLGKYLTSVLIETKSGKSFEEEIRSLFGEEAGFVGLQMSRACKITD